MKKSDTLSLSSLQVFDCEMIPVPPGTKADRGSRKRFTASATWWWLLFASAIVTALAVGWLIGRL
jgi:hypothetical protein